MNDIDLILEVHKQFELIEKVQSEEETTEAEAAEEFKESLSQVKLRISHLERLNDAHNFLSTVSIPSVASSPTFSSSLRLLLQHQNGQLLTPQLIQRICYFEQKCWDNAILAMGRVLERDLVSIEAYLDDGVYKEMRDKVLKELIEPVLINPKIFNELIIHFIESYCQLRENFVTFVLDTRLNTQFSCSPPSEQVLHFIERTRLLMVVERSEFLQIFSCLPNNEFLKGKYLNKILETVGNLLFQRIELTCKQLTNQNSEEISSFIHPLMESILIESNQKDPFGLFLKLLTQKFNFTKKPPILKIITSASDPVSNVNNVNSVNSVNSVKDVNIDDTTCTYTNNPYNCNVINV